MPGPRIERVAANEWRQALIVQSQMKALADEIDELKTEWNRLRDVRNGHIEVVTELRFSDEHAHELYLREYDQDDVSIAEAKIPSRERRDRSGW